tara:strand:+ start:20187 stop:20588 length:402 start_codon:yes stop_codon:yes gene_type:complete
VSALEIGAALEVALAAMSPALPTAYENADFDKPALTEPRQRVNVLFATPDNLVYGSEYQELGYMQVTLMYPVQQGVGDALARAELLRTTFSRGSSFTSGGSTAIIHKTPEIGSGFIDDEMYSLPVKIKFYSNS